MDDILHFIFRVLCIIGDFLINVFSGTTLNQMFRLPGMLLYKIIWPPNWFRKMEDDGITFYIMGVIFYILSAIFFGLYCCKIDS